VTAPPRPRSGELRAIQAPVREQLERLPDEMWRIVAAEPGLVSAVADHLMAMRGKMFRPTLVLLSSAVGGGSADDAISMAAVTELIHLASLVHDDSVDHSALRRGMPTVNSVFSHQVSVIMGDYLYARALAELVRVGDMDLLRVVMRASTEMSLGELRQFAALDTLAFSETDYYRLIRAKTASLLGACCELGGAVGAPEHRAALARYGDRLGMAFQIVDDLLDYTGSAETTGKPAGLDLREHKVTLPLLGALRTMTASERTRVEALFAAPDPSDDEIAAVIGLVVEQGGLEHARRQGERFAQEAEEALGLLPDTPARASLGDAIGYVLDRRW
jgi:octaprenyl-diphosphate synthase